MSTLPPRAVVVTRKTEVEALVNEHGTLRQAAFILESRGLQLNDIEDRSRTCENAKRVVLGQVPLAWRRAVVDRTDLDRFLFEPEDIILAVGQDGLVANVSKYLSGQPVVGINPGLFDGELVRHHPAAAGELMKAAAAGEVSVQRRVLAEATTSLGQSLRALNEVFIGHQSHQSARYRLQAQQNEERHSSSGVVVATGTGATGWASSIVRRREGAPALPGPEDLRLVFLVREAFASGETQCGCVDGNVNADSPLVVTSEMGEGGVVFGDGIEGDFLRLPFGASVTVRPSKSILTLVA